ncbi:MAG: hypothetical protein QOJ37_235 [Pseudonocardiales bacterium]|nr:hypothetical protein [Pseudonocardiales bacterium]
MPDDPDDNPDPPPAETPPVPLLHAPRDGVPEPLVDPARLDALVAALRAGHGPVALDAERASGYRYSQRAYLVQLRRAGVGTALIDPIALPDLAELSGREIEVLHLVADGRSNKEIGEALGLSALTVKSHLARIARKLGTGDRAEMVAMAMRAGVIR